jgi:hypothetical protein
MAPHCRHQVATTMCNALGAGQVWERRTQVVTFQISLVLPTSRHGIAAWQGVQCSPACTQAALREHPTHSHHCTDCTHRRMSCASRSGGGTNSWRRHKRGRRSFASSSAASNLTWRLLLGRRALLGRDAAIGVLGYKVVTAEARAADLQQVWNRVCSLEVLRYCWYAPQCGGTAVLLACAMRWYCSTIGFAPCVGTAGSKLGLQRHCSHGCVL